MIRYEDDERAVARAISETDGVIDHGTARTIAAWFNDPQTVTFVTTGAIPVDDGDPDDEPAEYLMEDIRHGVDARTLRLNESALNALHEYLVQRVADGDTDAIEGWASMDVARHVDYPHETGALDTCWCFGEEDDAED